MNRLIVRQPLLDEGFRETEACFRAFMDHSPAVAWMKDEDGRYIYANEPMLLIYHTRMEELRGKTDFDWLPRETARHVRDNDRLVLTTGRPARLVETTPTPDGRTHTWMVIKFPFEDAAGRRLVGGMAVDVTELKALEAQLAEQLERANELNAELLRANTRLTELAATDGLTGLKNYRHFREVLDSTWSLAIRQGRPLSVAMLDVDEFKRYNDAFGHQAGDDVLCTLSTVLRATVRRHDLVARYGGEEFILLLPDTGLSASRVAAERLRVAVERYDWPLRAVTVSVGVATLDEGTRDPTGLIERADNSLYRSKRGGRNRVTHY